MSISIKHVSKRFKKFFTDLNKEIKKNSNGWKDLSHNARQWTLIIGAPSNSRVVLTGVDVPAVDRAEARALVDALTGGGRPVVALVGRLDPVKGHDDLFAAIRKGEPYSEAEYGATSSMTAILGRMATYSGKVITWDEAINSTKDLSPAEYDWNATPPVVPDSEGNYPIAVPGQYDPLT